MFKPTMHSSVSVFSDGPQGGGSHVVFTQCNKRLLTHQVFL